MKEHARQTDKEISARIRSARILAGISQEKLGAYLGVSFQQIQKYEKGANRVSGGSLYYIARALRIPVENFFPDSAGKAPEFSEDETRLLRAYRRLAPDMRRLVLAQTEAIARGERSAA